MIKISFKSTLTSQIWPAGLKLRSNILVNWAKFVFFFLKISGLTKEKIPKAVSQVVLRYYSLKIDQNAEFGKIRVLEQTDFFHRTQKEGSAELSHVGGIDLDQ